MRVQLNERTVELVVGDITRQEVDAIVNAANSRLAGGGGVDGAIHRAGGPGIIRETDEKYPQGCPTGSAVLTGAGNLSAKYVLHAVGPVWRDGKHGEPQLLAGAHRRCLELAVEHQCRSIAFPAISTGVYGYPVPLAARVALSEVIRFLAADLSSEIDHPLRLVRFVLFGGVVFDQFAKVLTDLTASEANGAG